MRALIILAIVAVAYGGMAYRERRDSKPAGMAYREKSIVKKAGMAYRERAVLDGFLCALCEPLVEEAEDVGIEYSDEYLRGEIDKSCTDLGFFKQLCIDQMEEVVAELDQYIQQSYSPKVCCEKVGLC